MRRNAALAVVGLIASAILCSGRALGLAGLASSNATLAENSEPASSVSYTISSLSPRSICCTFVSTSLPARMSRNCNFLSGTLSIRSAISHSM